jgi:hypothetical protein
VAELRGQFGKQEKRKRSPLKTVSSERVKTELTEKTYCVLQ